VQSVLDDSVLFLYILRVSSGMKVAKKMLKEKLIIFFHRISEAIPFYLFVMVHREISLRTRANTGVLTRIVAAVLCVFYSFPVKESKSS